MRSPLQRGEHDAFVQIETLPDGRALVDVDKITHAVPQEEGTRLFLGAQQLDVPHTLAELENVLAERERGDDGITSVAGLPDAVTRGN